MSGTCSTFEVARIYRRFITLSTKYFHWKNGMIGQYCFIATYPSRGKHPVRSFLKFLKERATASLRRASMFSFLLLITHSLVAAELRLGIIGTDSSHVVEFTRILNDVSDSNHVPGAHIVAVYASSSADIAASHNRASGFETTLRTKWQLPFVSSIQQMCPMVDGILIETNDGRIHLEQFRQAAACGKPVFIDKPLAATLTDIRKIAQLAKAKNIPWFSASSLRFGPIQTLRSPDLTGAFVWGPGPLEPHHQIDLSWYAIHPAEMLFTLMGPDVEQVTRTFTTDADEITGVWKGGRIGTFRALRPYGSYGAVTFLPGNKTASLTRIEAGYVPLLQKIVTFMQTRIPPVPNAETIQLYTFLDAARRSRNHKGAPIRMSK
jgi:hypothetical protein